MSDGTREVKLGAEVVNASGQAQTVSAATEEQSASMEEITSSSQALAKLAMELRQFSHTIENYRLKIGMTVFFIKSINARVIGDLLLLSHARAVVVL